MFAILLVARLLPVKRIIRYSPAGRSNHRSFLDAICRRAILLYLALGSYFFFPLRQILEAGCRSNSSGDCFQGRAGLYGWNSSGRSSFTFWLSRLARLGSPTCLFQPR